MTGAEALSTAVYAEVTIGERSLVIHHAKDSIANGIFLVPEDRRQEGLIVGMTVRENTTLPSLGNYSTAGLISRDDCGTAAKLFT